MASQQIYEHDIPELGYFAQPHTDYSKSVLTPLMSIKHPTFGVFQVSNIVFPDIQLMDMQWNIPDQLTIHESHPAETIDINFVLEGNVLGTFKGLGAEFALRGGTNNLKFTPSEKSVHCAAQQNANFFTISITKNHFQNLIGFDNAWAEGIQRKLERNENFIASNYFLDNTPRMTALLHSIRTMQSGPMSRMMVQSLMFELIAQQINQLVLLDQVKSSHNEISTLDIEKLHRIKQYIEQHFLEDLSLTSLCREATLNEFKLKKGFKSVFGTSVINYVRQLRMEFAQSQLRDHRITIDEVAKQLGYHYANHFSTAYKKYFGAVPSVR